MEGMGKKMPRPRPSFTPEIVELCRWGDRSVGRIAKNFGLSDTAVRDTSQQFDALVDQLELCLSVGRT
ncbi:hypothetical protein ACQPZG_32495 [Streptomyces sp. CA-294286]|uniref:hypothetical protein n=1 Tax=Streptomyces sp. CA-294286 TaxID=3240070 RepID=UPI003D8E3EF4